MRGCSLAISRERGGGGGDAEAQRAGLQPCARSGLHSEAARVDGRSCSSGPLTTAVATDTMRARLRKTLLQIGVTEVDLFGFHSFRRGGATAAHLGQISRVQIMIHGRWRSDCVCKYIYRTAYD